MCRRKHNALARYIAVVFHFVWLGADIGWDLCRRKRDALARNGVVVFHCSRLSTNVTKRHFRRDTAEVPKIFYSVSLPQNCAE